MKRTEELLAQGQLELGTYECSNGQVIVEDDENITITRNLATNCGECDHYLGDPLMPCAVNPRYDGVSTCDEFERIPIRHEPS